ncbi:hypothetical protein V7161_29165 [Neobacillus drentensis]
MDISVHTSNNKIEVIDMGNWNEQAAPNNNLPPKTIRSSEMMLGDKANHAFKEVLSDGGERDQFIKRQKNDLKMK